MIVCFYCFYTSSFLSCYQFCFYFGKITNETASEDIQDQCFATFLKLNSRGLTYLLSQIKTMKEFYLQQTIVLTTFFLLTCFPRRFSQKPKPLLSVRWFWFWLLSLLTPAACSLSVGSNSTLQTGSAPSGSCSPVSTPANCETNKPNGV